MYIGPWQEYKLARLIQAQPGLLQETPGSKAPTPLSRQRGIDRVRSGNTDHLETASVASSSRSGYSTRSAPPRVSAQSRLDNMYQDAERERVNRTPSLGGRPGSDAGRPPRPRNTGVRRGGRQQSGMQKTAAKKAAPKLSADAERRARIAQMQRLYGLSSALPADEASTPPLSPMGAADSNASNSQRLPPTMTEQNVASSPPRMPPSQTKSNIWEEPVIKVPEFDELDGSDGIIAWSRMLKPEDLSPEATLASFFQPV